MVITNFLYWGKVATQGRGGVPLNVVITGHLSPILQPPLPSPHLKPLTQPWLDNSHPSPRVQCYPLRKSILTIRLGQTSVLHADLLGSLYSSSGFLASFCFPLGEAFASCGLCKTTSLCPLVPACIESLRMQVPALAAVPSQ